jgi:hypothetical protein
MSEKAGKSEQLPGYTVRVWASRDSLAKLKSLASTTELSQTELATRINEAGIEAVHKYVQTHGFLTIPLRFAVEEKPKR